MNLYTLTYNANLPTKQQINIPTNTDYKVGVKIVRNGNEQIISPSDVTLGTLSADADTTNGYVTFTETAGDEASYTQKSLTVDKQYIGFGPDESSSLSAKLTSSLSKVNITTANEALAPCFGKTLIGSNVLLEYSLDGQTWKSIDPAIDFWFYICDGGVQKYYWYGAAADYNFVDVSTEERYEAIEIADTYSLSSNNFTTNKFTPYCSDWPGGNPSAANPLYIRVYFKLGDGEMHLVFSLVENVYKSQVGDKDFSLTMDDFQSTTFAGQFADGTDFSYDVLVK